MRYHDRFAFLFGLCLMGYCSLQAQNKSQLLLIGASNHSKETPEQGADLAELFSKEINQTVEPVVLNFKSSQVLKGLENGDALVRIPVRIGFTSGVGKVPSGQTGLAVDLKVLNRDDLDGLTAGATSIQELKLVGEFRAAQLDLSAGEIVLSLSLSDLTRYQSGKNDDYTIGLAISEWSANKWVDELIVPDIRDRVPSLEVFDADEADGGCHPKMRAYALPWSTHLDDVFRVVGQYFSPHGRCEVTLRYLGDGQNNPLPHSPSYKLGPFITNEHGAFETRFSFKNPEYPTMFRVLGAGVQIGAIHNHEVVPFEAGTYSVRISDIDTGCAVDTEIVALGDPVLELSRPSGPFLGQVNDDPLTLTGTNFRPSSPVNVYFMHPERGQVLVEEVETNGEGEFRVLDLFFRGGGAFSLSGPTIIRAVGEGGYRAEARFVLEQPRLYVSVGGEVGHQPRGNAFSELRITGINFPPNGNRQIRIERAPNDPRDPGDRPIATAQVNRDGFFSHVVTAEEWPPEDREDGDYQCVFRWENTFHEEGSFSLAQCLGDVHPDVSVTGLEVTQGLQTLANTVPLIHRKATWVRVYVQSDLQDVGPLTCFLSATNEDGEVLTYFDGQVHQPSIRNLRNIEATTVGSRRGNLLETFNFRLPHHWVREVGEVTFRARVFSRICEASDENNERSETVFFRPTVGLNVTQIRLHTHRPRQLPFEDWEYFNGEPFYNRYWDMWSSLSTLPLTTHHYQMFNSRDRLEPVLHFSVAGEHFGDEYDDDIRDFDSFWALIARLNWYDMWTADPDGQTLGPHFWYGLFPKNDGNDRGKSAGPVTEDNSLGIVEGVALGPYNRDGQTYYRTRAGIVFAHEITHLIGLRHIDCNDPDDPDGNWPHGDTARIGEGTEEGAWGMIPWDGANPPQYANGLHPVASLIAPTDATPLMGYCNDRWISDYEYELIHNRLNPFIEDWIQYRAEGGPLSYPEFHIQMLVPGGGRPANEEAVPNVSRMRPLVETAPEASFQYYLTGLYDQVDENVILDEFWVLGSNSAPTTPPETTTPDTTIPDTTIPETTIPETTIPETTIPETTIPETTIPETTIPETTIPETTIPETTIPETTVPETMASDSITTGMTTLQEKDITTDAEEGPLWLKLTDSSGTILLDRPLQLQPLSDGLERWLILEKFTLKNKAHQMEIYNPQLQKTHELLLATMDAPEVGLTEYPYGLVGEQITVGLAATDPDSDVLSMMTQFSADGGSNWRLVSGERTQDAFGILQFQFDASSLPHTTEGLFRVLVSDGFNTSIASMTDPFLVPNHSPVLSVSSPSAPHLVSISDKTNPVPFDGSQEIRFAAHASDLDGPVQDTAMVWTSDLNGYIGSGREVHARMVPGRHRITVSVQDNQGASDEKTFVILVRGDAANEDDFDRDGVLDALDPFPKHAFWMSDKDKDGMADEWERLEFGSIETVGLTSDFDRDGILDVVEFDLGTSPRLFNTLPQEPSEPEAPVGKPDFQPGWNMVSGASLNQYESLTAVIGASGADLILGYRATDQTWVKVYVADDPEDSVNNDAPFEDSAGYWVHVPGEDEAQGTTAP